MVINMFSMAEQVDSRACGNECCILNAPGLFTVAIAFVSSALSVHSNMLAASTIDVYSSEHAAQ